MINQFKEAVAAKPSCIEIMGHPGSTAFHDLVKDAVDQGIVVTVGNSPLTDLQKEFGPKGIGYAGLDLYAGGALTANSMIKAGKLKSGDEAWSMACSARPSAGSPRKASPIRLKRRASRSTGSRSARRSTPITTLGVPILTAYIQSHPNLKAIGLQHGGVTGMLPEALQKAGKKPGDIIVGGIDLAPATIDGLKSGYISASLDQLLYMQGFMPVVQCVISREVQDAGARPQHRRRHGHADDTVGDLTKLIDAGIR